MPSRLRRPLALCAALCAALVAALLPGSAATGLTTRGAPRPALSRFHVSARVVNDLFVAGRYYHGDFPDPAVLRVGRTYYAYSTTFAGMNLPVLRSTDLVHWRSVGEGQLGVPPWTARRRTRTGSRATTWAPSTIQVGRVFVHAYAVQARPAASHLMCLSVSRSHHPWGGFVDVSRRPLICPRTHGAIDPQYFTAPNGRRYLLWKSDQDHHYQAQLWITPVTHDGLRIAGTSHQLLHVQQPWEGAVVENPSMIGFHGRYYLFYSGGSYADASYATGYATCRTPVGPCTRVGTLPLLATGGRVAGPGGAMAFYDASSRLRLAYAAWDYGHTGYPATTACLRTAYGCDQRRLHVATLALSTDPSAAPGTLVVTSRG